MTRKSREEKDIRMIRDIKSEAGVEV
jgi:N-acetylglutamate synthase-like GNAT family acetyltransferase